MVMLLRLMRVLLTVRARGRAGILDETFLRLRVWPNDIDLNVHMNNGRYFSAADIGRFDHWLRSGLWSVFRSRGWRPMMGDATARFSRPLPPLTRYTLASRLIGWDGKWLYTQHRFERRGETLAVVTVRYLFVTANGRKLAPAEVLAAAGGEASAPKLPAWVVAWSAGADTFSAELRAMAQAPSAKKKRRG